MNEYIIDELRDKLYILIAEEADYNDVLKVSQELDFYITKFMYEDLKDDSTKLT